MTTPATIEYLEGCRVCDSNRGIDRISPGPVVYEGSGWQVEHAYPCALLGWLVIVLRRHAVALHELTSAEAEELGRLQRCVALALHRRFGTAKEYLVCYGEAEGFEHLHVHVVPRQPGLPDELKGGGMFRHLQPRESALLDGMVADFCRRIGEDVASLVEASR